MFDLDDPTLLFRADVLDDPAPLYAQLRRRAPVWEMPGTGTFVVSSAELVTEAVNRPADFSSNLLSLVFRGDDGRPVVFDMTRLGAAIYVLATADAPTHTVHRKLLQPAFSPGAVERLAGSVAETADALLDPLLRTGRGDAATRLAEPLPVRMICRVVGIPDDDVAALAPLVLQSNDLLAGVLDAEMMASAATAAMETTKYLTDLLAGWRAGDRAEPTICRVLAGAVAAEEITFEDAVGILVQLLGAGTETTTGLIGRAVLQLARDPSLQQRVRDRPDLVPAVLEETLRIDGPFRFHYRAVTHDTELGGVRIPAGSRLLLMWASANLDDAEIDRPEQFDVERPVPRAHFAFGRGIHFCIGAPLARLEGRIVLERLLARTTSFAVDDDRAVRIRPSIFLRRLASLPLTLVPA
ncbi:MAG TPA: cytochrome P450 [Acidimicrobiia bacterium]|nr:cytochrome P450 [Acidimicrobiia bacterium]